MKSEWIERHFITLKQQREEVFPTLQTLSTDQLWERPEQDKWAIGASIYHLYLMLKLYRHVLQITIPCTRLYALSMRKRNYSCCIADIYEEYKETRNKSMKAPFILNPPDKIRFAYDFTELRSLLTIETEKIIERVVGLDEDIAGHMHFLDPVANYPNIIQGTQLLAIHEAHHFRIIERDRKVITNE